MWSLQNAWLFYAAVGGLILGSIAVLIDDSSLPLSNDKKDKQ